MNKREAFLRKVLENIYYLIISNFILIQKILHPILDKLYTTYMHTHQKQKYS